MNALQLHIHWLFTATALACWAKMANEECSALQRDFDQIAIVVDWLDACRSRDLEALLHLYATDACMRCTCDGITTASGKTELASYWRDRFDHLASTAFGLEAIVPVSEGVRLDYSSFEGRPVRILFEFSDDGKILRTCCGPITG